MKDIIALAIAEDIGDGGDITTDALVPDDATCSASFVSRRTGVLSGAASMVALFRQIDEALSLEILASEGDGLEPGQSVAKISGRVAPILAGERIALNLLSHLSGIATYTRGFVDQLGSLPAKIVDTRKTAPGLRELEKAAVRAGGGSNHRMGLYDGYLIKDNHIATLGGDIARAIALARAHSSSSGTRIAVEVDAREQFLVAVDEGVEMILLDNMTPEQVGAITPMKDDTIIEVSGGVTLENVREYAEAGADRIAIGALTHSAPALDIGLDIIVGV